MSKEIEFERTFLLKSLPENLEKLSSKEIIDIYVPKEKAHPNLRIRKNGSKYEITKKSSVKGNDFSHQEEHTIALTEEEFKDFSKIDGKKTHKIRYEAEHNGKKYEIDVFQGSLKGLILIDFEFDSKEQKDSFQMPEFCLADVTQEEFLAGGMLCGKSYEDIKDKLEGFSYKKVL